MEIKAKEYAQELVNRFMPCVEEWDSTGDVSRKNAKQCALICCEELIKIAPRVDTLPPNIGIVTWCREFYESVKREIEAL